MRLRKSPSIPGLPHSPPLALPGATPTPTQPEMGRAAAIAARRSSSSRSSCPSSSCSWPACSTSVWASTRTSRSSTRPARARASASSIRATRRPSRSASAPWPTTSTARSCRSSIRVRAGDRAAFTSCSRSQVAARDATRVTVDYDYTTFFPLLFGTEIRFVRIEDANRVGTCVQTTPRRGRRTCHRLLPRIRPGLTALRVGQARRADGRPHGREAPPPVTTRTGRPGAGALRPLLHGHPGHGRARARPGPPAQDQPRPPQCPRFRARSQASPSCTDDPVAAERVGARVRAAELPGRPAGRGRHGQLPLPHRRRSGAPRLKDVPGLRPGHRRLVDRRRQGRLRALRPVARGTSATSSSLQGPPSATTTSHRPWA